MSSNEPVDVKRENILESRKTAGFVVMVLSILALVWLVSHMGTPPEIAIAALYMVAAGGMFTIGGQALVDSVAKWRSGSAQPTSLSESTTTTRTVDVVKP